MRRVLLGVLCGLLAAAGVSASGAGTLGHARESLQPMAHPVKVAKLDSRLVASRAGEVHVELLATRPARARAAVTRNGGRVERAYGGVIEAVVPARALTALARSGDVRFVREPVATRAGVGAGTGCSNERCGPLAQGRSARRGREDRRRRPRVQRVPPEPGHRRPPGLGGQGRLLPGAAASTRRPTARASPRSWRRWRPTRSSISCASGTSPGSASPSPTRAPTGSRSSATPQAGSTPAGVTAPARPTRRMGSSPQLGPQGSSG